MIQRTLLLIGLLSICLLDIKGSHLIGGGITYNCIGANTYEIKLVLYRDCKGVQMREQEYVYLKSASCRIRRRFTLTSIEAGVNISPLCSELFDQNSCDGGSFVGIEQYTYVGEITLPANCSDWIVGWSNCCRNEAITNLPSPESIGVYLEAQINNLDVSCNSSPTFTQVPTPYVCNGQLALYNNGAVDQEGDSLVFELINPLESENTPISFMPAFTATNPIHVDPQAGFLLDPRTGQLSFIPLGIQQGVLSIRVKEYRNGVHIGSTMRDLQLIVINCSNSTTEIEMELSPRDAANNATNTNQLQFCLGSLVQLQLAISDSDPASILSMTHNLATAIPGATVSLSGQNPLLLQIDWISSLPGIYPFTVSIKKEVCPVAIFRTQTFEFEILSPPVWQAEIDSLDCYGDEDGKIRIFPVNPSATLTYTWDSGYTGSELTDLREGIYQLKVTDDLGCSAQTQYELLMPEKLEVYTNMEDVNCAGAASGNLEFEVEGGFAPYTSLLNGVEIYNSYVSNLPAGQYDLLVLDKNACSVIQTVEIFEPDSLKIIQQQITHISCFGEEDGAIAVEAVGGSPPYTYQWADGATSAQRTRLLAGRYSLQLIDSYGCIRSQEIELYQPDPLSLAVESQNVRCYGEANGQLQLQISGGTAPYFSLVDGIADHLSNLPAGSYAILLTDSMGCEISTNASIDQPEALIISQQQLTPITCFGETSGSIEVQAAQGTAPYTYQWADGVISAQRTQLAAGTYLLTLTDLHGCSLVEAFTLSQPEPLSLIPTEIGVDLCEQEIGYARVEAAGGITPYSYQWDSYPPQSGPFATNLAGGMYEIQLTDAYDCQHIVQVEIPSTPAVQAAFQPKIVSSTDPFLPHSPISFLNYSRYAQAYQWDFGDASLMTDEESPIHSYSQAGSYTVTLIAFDEDYACPDTAQFIVAIIPAAVYIPNAFSPNGDGINDEFYVQGESIANLQLSIFDRWGKLIKQLYQVSENWSGRDMHGGQVPEGVYVYTLKAQLYNGYQLERGGTITLLR